MNIDCLSNIVLYCNICSVLKLSSSNKKLMTFINDDSFWKLLIFRDFEDINKSEKELWVDYYKKRYIDYGIPISINNNVYQYNQVKEFVSFSENKKHHNLILTKYGELYIIDNDGFTQINHTKKFKKIFCCNKFYFIDYDDNLYLLDSNKLIKFIKPLVTNVIFDPYGSNIYITDKNFTYYINNDVNQKILDFEILDMVNLNGIDYIIDIKNNFISGGIIDNKYKLIYYELDASQLSHINKKTIIILGLDCIVRIFRNNTFRKIDIPNVKMLGYNSFLTKNGDLYYFDKNYIPILIDINVIHVSHVMNNGEDGCYVKRFDF